MVFRSVTYSAHEVDFTLSRPAMELKDYQEQPSGGWDVVEVPMTKLYRMNYRKYGPSPDVSIQLDLTAARKCQFYIITFLLPCVCIAFLTVFLFYLPTASGEKLCLAISILFSIVVFLLILIDILPPSDTLPLMTKFLREAWSIPFQFIHKNIYLYVPCNQNVRLIDWLISLKIRHGLPTLDSFYIGKCSSSEVSHWIMQFCWDFSLENAVLLRFLIGNAVLLRFLIGNAVLLRIHIGKCSSAEVSHWIVQFCWDFSSENAVLLRFLVGKCSSSEISHRKMQFFWDFSSENAVLLRFLSGKCSSAEVSHCFFCLVMIFFEHFQIVVVLQTPSTSMVIWLFSEKKQQKWFFSWFSQTIMVFIGVRGLFWVRGVEWCKNGLFAWIWLLFEINFSLGSVCLQLQSDLGRDHHHQRQLELPQPQDPHHAGLGAPRLHPLFLAEIRRHATPKKGWKEKTLPTGKSFQNSPAKILFKIPRLHRIKASLGPFRHGRRGLHGRWADRINTANGVASDVETSKIWSGRGSQ